MADLTPTPSATKTTVPTIVTFGVLLALFGALYVAPRVTLAVMLGLLLGALGQVPLAIVARLVLRRHRGRAVFVVLATVASAAGCIAIWPIMGTGFAIGCGLLAYYLIIGDAIVFYARNRVLERMRARLATGAPIDAELARIATWSTAMLDRAMLMLLAHGRAAEAERVVCAAPLGTSSMAILDRGFHLVTLRLALDDVARARAVLDELAASSAQYHPLAPAVLALLGARVAIAAGQASEVLPTIAASLADPELPEHVRMMFEEVRADVASATGDRELARRILEALSPANVASLAKSNRPSAAIAIELAALVPPQPFR